VKSRYVIFPGEERFSLGAGVTATPLAALAEEVAA
jgi:hypothetical protein